MVKQAEQHAAEDKKRKEEVETRNAADAAVFTAEKALRDGGDKVAADVKAEVEAKVAAVKKAQEGRDLEAIKQAADALYQAVQKVGAAMYGQPGAGPMPGGEGGPGGAPGDGGKPGGDDVVEGQFKEA